MSNCFTPPLTPTGDQGNEDEQDYMDFFFDSPPVKKKLDTGRMLTILLHIFLKRNFRI